MPLPSIEFPRLLAGEGLGLLSLIPLTLLFVSRLNRAILFRLRDQITMAIFY